jgi:hypothetical protein
LNKEVNAALQDDLPDRPIDSGIGLDFAKPSRSQDFERLGSLGKIALR